MYTGRMKSEKLAAINSDEVAHYQREGYVVINRPILPDDKFRALKAHFEEKLAQWPKDKRPEAMDTPHFDDPRLLEWALDDAIVDLVEPILGPDIILFSTHFICKPQGDGRRVPWHEDSAYWKGKLDPMEVCTVWFAVDPSTVENACMHVIPRTHDSGRQGYSDYDEVDVAKNVFPTEVTPSQRRDQLAVPIELQANECSLHDARLMHGSPANTSDQRRCGWTLRFTPAHVKLNPAMQDVHLVYQARGRNLSGQPVADPTRSYTEVAAERSRRGIKSH